MSLERRLILCMCEIIHLYIAREDQSFLYGMKVKVIQMAIHKKDIIKLLEKIALYLEIKGENPFRINAYRRAAQGLERDERSLTEIEDFTTIRGIGQGTNAIIEEFIEQGTCALLTELKDEVPQGLIPLLSLPGLGGKRIAKLYQDLGVTDIESLKDACESGAVEKLPGFGKKSTKNILAAIEDENSRPDRLPVAVILPVAHEIETYLSDIQEIKQFSRAGSLRRMRETIKDIDFIIATDHPSKVRDHILNMEHVKDIVAQGDTKISITLEDVYDINVDFRLVTPAEFATSLHHFTGSKDHNIMMRQLAKARGEKISEYGVEKEDTGEVLTFSSEKEFFNHFDLHYIPPEVRENRGEGEAFKQSVPLITVEDIRGDLHMHTSWSDGAQSIEEMVIHAQQRGYEYIAITDHSKYLRVANGLTEACLRRQREEIDRLNEKYPNIHIFAGVEMDILPDGQLDFSNDFLREMDIVIAAIHSGFNQSNKEIMTRLHTALENPYVDIIAHPTGRLIGRRDGYDVDVEQLLQKAKETNTTLEVNANPNRLDLSAEWIKRAADIGVTLAINTDAHSYQMFDHMDYGVSVAIKGWSYKEQVMNTWSKEALSNYLYRNH